VVELLCTGSRTEIMRAMEKLPPLVTAYHSYLEQFADRCLEELKLESATLRDDPLPLLRSIGHMARRLQTQPDSQNKQREVLNAATPRAQAEQRAAEQLHGHPLRRLIFGWMLKQTRERVRDRENLRFERTRVFGRVRRIFSELGRRLYALDLLEEPRDIFYLEVEEALGFVTGTATTANLKGLTALRKAEFAGFHTLAPAQTPSNRFETRGIVNQGNTFREQTRRQSAPLNTQETSGAQETAQRKGIGCCPGIVRGPVRVVTDPRTAELHSGEILVARRTDPGWILLFPAAAGVLVEYGSLLSHSAIVAREMGIPTIVGLSNVTGWLHDGDWVELDGSSGIVRKIER
jgi:phosphohistidine swiveling domain-containing protein